ncbi:hypothetical protein [Pseudoclavibacter sp. RFBA6]|uniref:hypothetical protein n=1 Tax=Pseudoclavibacter sp. RFBA6 TaxID=2080573 RepID=UPI000CE71F4C|nr:hypothetical protein [Pseudoclavibacter sp. RFBA6]PPG43724.1 hypothetical protein C5C17_00370 [Pseudoclavibacter sp. RFBA6]
MSTIINDPITVEMANDEPRVFWWQRFPYLITAQPLLFYRRKPAWWHGTGSMRRLDDAFWRVSAARDGTGEEPQLYDLKFDGEQWSLVHIF